jgi:hypothetical protein
MYRNGHYPQSLVGNYQFGRLDGSVDEFTLFEITPPSQSDYFASQGSSVMRNFLGEHEQSLTWTCQLVLDLYNARNAIMYMSAIKHYIEHM